MPIIKSAKKKLKQTVKKTRKNALYESAFKKALAALKKTKDKKSLDKTYSAIDRAVKKKIFHKRKGARLKSAVASFYRPQGKIENK